MARCLSPVPTLVPPQAWETQHPGSARMMIQPPFVLEAPISVGAAAGVRGPARRPGPEPHARIRRCELDARTGAAALLPGSSIVAADASTSLGPSCTSGPAALISRSPHASALACRGLASPSQSGSSSRDCASMTRPDRKSQRRSAVTVHAWPREGRTRPSGADAGPSCDPIG